MPTHFKSISAIGFSIILAACAQQESAPVTSEPIYNKVGDVTGCRSSDGTITDAGQTAGAANRGQRNPCEPPPPGDCVDGYTSAQVPCNDPREGEEPGRNPTGGQTAG